MLTWTTCDYIRYKDLKKQLPSPLIHLVLSRLADPSKKSTKIYDEISHDHEKNHA